MSARNVDWTERGWIRQINSEIGNYSARRALDVTQPRRFGGVFACAVCDDLLRWQLVQRICRNLKFAQGEASMTAFVIFDVEIRDSQIYQEFMREVKPALQSAGARYLARGGQHKVYEGDWVPRRMVILQFPSMAAWESFYFGPVYQNLKAIRDRCSSARLVCVEGE